MQYPVDTLNQGEMGKKIVTGINHFSRGIL